MRLPCRVPEAVSRSVGRGRRHEGALRVSPPEATVVRSWTRTIFSLLMFALHSCAAPVSCRLYNAACFDVLCGSHGTTTAAQKLEVDIANAWYVCAIERKRVACVAAELFQMCWHYTGVRISRCSCCLSINFHIIMFHVWYLRASFPLASWP